MGPQPTKLTAKDLVVDREAALRLVPVSRETVERLDHFVELFLQWQSVHNLVAPSTVPHLWTRHIADSLQLLALAPTATHWLDVGSGGGFPGVVLACALVEREGAQIDLVERAGKKAAFLREAIRITQSPGHVHLADIGDYVERLGKPVDCVTARAVAPLEILCEAVAPLVQRGAMALLPKGQDVEKELTQATKYWNIDYRLVPSRVPAGGSIVAIDRLTRQPASTSDE